MVNSNGIVDKYIGETVMALWNTITPRPQHAREACVAALACRFSTLKLQKRATTKKHPRTIWGASVRLTRCGLSSYVWTLNRMAAPRPAAAGEPHQRAHRPGARGQHGLARAAELHLHWYAPRRA